jgi:pyruvate dehydrogenase complex dehydrogenase (E1) component
VDAKHIVLATLHALASEKPADKKDGEVVTAKMLEKAIRDLGIDPEKRNPAIS